jgi:hypothetical protein
MAEPPDLVIEATEVTTGGVAVYPVDVLVLKKDLEAGGIRVEFEHPASQRGYKRSYNDTTELVVSFGVRLGPSGTIAALQCLAGLGGSRTVRITATRATKTSGTATDEKYEYEGPAKDAEQAVRSWRDDQSPDATTD